MSCGISSLSAKLLRVIEIRATSGDEEGLPHRSRRQPHPPPSYGLAHPAALEHLTTLGVTAVELLPIHQFVHEQHRLDKGLRNYWGYHPYGYFAPHGEYSSSGDTGGQVRAFKQR